MNTQTELFFNKNEKTAEYNWPKLPEGPIQAQAHWLVHESRIPFLEVRIDAPFKEMYDEANAIKDMFVEHRSDGQGWLSLCLHGISAQKTMNADMYGLPNDTPMTWTEIAEACPVSTNYFKNDFPFDEYHRLRFMLLKAGGYIPPHIDGKGFQLFATNLSLNQPEGCAMVQEDVGVVPFKNFGSVMVFNNSYVHAVANRHATEDRIHMIVHGIPGQRWAEVLVNSYKKFLAEL